MAFVHFGNLFGRAGTNNLSAGKAAFRTNVNNMVSAFNDIQVVFDDDDRMAAVDQLFDRIQQLGDILEMQSGSGLIEETEGMVTGRLAQEFGQLYPLCLSAGKGRGTLAQLQIAGAHIFECLQLGSDPFLIDEKVDGLGDRHLQHIMDIFAAIFDLQHILAITFTATLLARELNISHKLHFNGLDTFALTGFTASAWNIEGEMTGLVTHNLGLARIVKQIANAVESLGIGSAIGARGASNGGLIHHLHRINMMDTRELAMAAYRIFVGTQLLLNSCIQGIVDQG